MGLGGSTAKSENVGAYGQELISKAGSTFGPV
jgi:hypothetical protein